MPEFINTNPNTEPTKEQQEHATALANFTDLLLRAPEKSIDGDYLSKGSIEDLVEVVYDSGDHLTLAQVVTVRQGSDESKLLGAEKTAVQLAKIIALKGIPNSISRTELRASNEGVSGPAKLAVEPTTEVVKTWDFKFSEVAGPILDAICSLSSEELTKISSEATKALDTLGQYLAANAAEPEQNQ